MPNANYIKGRAAEYYMKRVLESVGYIVTRSAASLGIFDLVGLGKDGSIAIQAKRGKDPPSPAEWKGAVEADLHESIVRLVVWIPDQHVSGRLQPRVLWCSHEVLPWWVPAKGWQVGKPEPQPRLTLRAAPKPRNKPPVP